MVNLPIRRHADNERVRGTWSRLALRSTGVLLSPGKETARRWLRSSLTFAAILVLLILTLNWSHDAGDSTFEKLANAAGTFATVTALAFVWHAARWRYRLISADTKGQIRAAAGPLVAPLRLAVIVTAVAGFVSLLATIGGGNPATGVICVFGALVGIAARNMR